MTDFIDDAIKSARLKLNVTQEAEDTYRCIITSPHGELNRSIEMRPGSGAPKIGDLLLYYAEKAQQANSYDDIEEWADEFDHDPSSDETKKAYEKLMSDRNTLRQMLGPYTYDALMRGLEISQAINNARPR